MLPDSSEDAPVAMIMSPLAEDVAVPDDTETSPLLVLMAEPTLTLPLDESAAPLPLSSSTSPPAEE
jgi:hypothetical protein